MHVRRPYRKHIGLLVRLQYVQIQKVSNSVSNLIQGREMLTVSPKLCFSCGSHHRGEYLRCC